MTETQIFSLKSNTHPTQESSSLLIEEIIDLMDYSTDIAKIYKENILWKGSGWVLRAKDRDGLSCCGPSIS